MHAIKKAGSLSKSVEYLTCMHLKIESLSLNRPKNMYNIPKVHGSDLKLFLCCFSFFIALTSALSSDGLSLLALKAAIVKDPTQALLSWSESDPTPCKWAGVSCDNAHQKVVSISLATKNLTGYIPSEIGALTTLVSLDISHNFFTGSLPHHITTLQNLMHLDISSNSFNGSLPEGLSNLTHLTGTLNLSYNAFSGEIPVSFGLLPVMVSLDLRYNNLRGKIPLVGSLLNQGPTAFAGNPDLCGFPLSTPCSVPEAQNPKFLNNIPQKPENGDILSKGSEQSRKLKGVSVTVSVISAASLVIGVVFITLLVLRKKWRKMEGKTGKENASRMEIGGGRGRNDEGQKGKFVVMDEGFSLELEDLLRASAYVLGKSKTGIVYKVLVGGGLKGVSASTVVAVRRLTEGDTAWRFKDFEAEVESIVKVQHPNIVRLRAYYYANDEKLLISDFIRNGSLYSALHGGPRNAITPLPWASRLRIAQETARALMYIHESGPKKHVHGNMRSSKILLDDDLKPYISGFGLSRLVPISKSADSAFKSSMNSSHVIYLAPEAQTANSRLTQKCDVYAFGIVLMEILTGRLPDDNGSEDGSNGKGLEGLVRKVFREERPLSEIIDPNLLQEVHAKKQVVAMFHVALNCTEMDPELRPRMRTVSNNLDCIKLQ